MHLGRQPIEQGVNMRQGFQEDQLMLRGGHLRFGQVSDGLQVRLLDPLPAQPVDQQAPGDDTQPGAGLSDVLQGCRLAEDVEEGVLRQVRRALAVAQPLAQPTQQPGMVIEIQGLDIDVAGGGGGRKWQRESLRDNDLQVRSYLILKELVGLPQEKWRFARMLRRTEPLASSSEVFWPTVVDGLHQERVPARGWWISRQRAHCAAGLAGRRGGRTDHHGTPR